MAAIEKIRKRSGLLIAIIGLALLAFVLQDLFQSQGRNREFNIAVVDGEKISYQDYEALRDKNVENMRNSGNLSSAETYSIYNSTLDNMVRNHIMTKEYEAVGMNVTSQELFDQFTGENPHQWVAQSFSNPDGSFNREAVEYNLQHLNEASPEYRVRWFDFEKAVKENCLETKFDNLVKTSFFLPTKLAEKYYNDKNTKASADVIALRYSTIPDSTVVVTEKDNKAFYEENKFRFETDERRDIEYVVFDITPSSEDRQAALKTVEDMRADFAATDDAVNFVNANSDRRYDSTWMGRKDVPQMIEKAIFDNGNGVGFVVGPYQDGETFNLARIIDQQSRPDSLRASHILISYKGAASSQDTVTTKEQAEAKANELLAQLKAAKNKDDLFAELAAQYNSDGTKDKGGDLDWFTDGRMVFPFNEYVVSNAVGTLGVVETMFGYHVVKVTGKTEPQPKVRLAFLQHEITSSTRTYQAKFAEANKFVTENKTYEQFNKAIEEQGLTKRTMPRMNSATYQIPGIENPRQIVRWAFEEKTKVGDVSNIFDLDNMFVVAALTNIVPEGYAPMSAMLDQAKYQIMNKKKGEMAVEKMKACGTDTDRMIKELGAESGTVSDVTVESRTLSNYGVEGDIVGTILGMKEGEQVGPVAGNTSAFIIKNVRIEQPAATTDYADILREKSSQYNNKVLNGAVYNALKNNAKIEDNRADFY